MDAELGLRINVWLDSNSKLNPLYINEVSAKELRYLIKIRTTGSSTSPF